MAGKRVAGPGRYAKRTDMDRPATPGLGGGDKGESDLQYGDVQQLQAGQSIARTVAHQRPPIDVPKRSAGAPSGGSSAQLPEFLFGESAMPTEPGTAGLTTGEGGGPELLDSRPTPPDLRAMTYAFVRDTFNNREAGDAYDRYLAEQSAPTQGPVPSPTFEEPAAGSTPGYAGDSVTAPTLDEMGDLGGPPAETERPGPAPAPETPPPSEGPETVPAEAGAPSPTAPEA